MQANWAPTLSYIQKLRTIGVNPIWAKAMPPAALHEYILVNIQDIQILLIVDRILSKTF